MAESVCYSIATRSTWPPKQGAMGCLPQLNEDLEHKITSWEREVDLKLRNSLWAAHVRTP